MDHGGAPAGRLDQAIGRTHPAILSPVDDEGAPARSGGASLGSVLAFDKGLKRPPVWAAAMVHGRRVGVGFAQERQRAASVCGTVIEGNMQGKERGWGCKVRCDVWR
jgi:hypothetical protein